MKRNFASQVIGAQLVSKTDGSAVTTGTTTCYITGDGGTQAAGSVGSGACTHQGNGYWEYAPAQAETDFAHVAFTFVNSASYNVTIQVYPSFPQTGDAFAKWTAAMTEAYAADGAAPTPEQALFMLISVLFERSISGTTLTAKKLDGTTAAMTFTLDDASAPTSQTRAT